MYLLYSVILCTWIAFMMPVFLYRALRRGKSLQGLPQRFGRLPESLRSDGRPTIWFHSCSLGETLSIQPLAKELHLRFPEARFVFSTITKTGQVVARQRFSIYGPDNTFYFPVDLASICRHFLDWIRPAVIVIIDTEIWPNLLRQAHMRGIPIVMANGRISPKSFRLYRLVRPLLRRVFANYHVFLMKSEDDAERIRKIGAPSDKVIVSGNIKYDKEAVEQEASKGVSQLLDEALGLTKPDGDIIVAGCTHEGEEQILIEVLRRIRRKHDLKKTRLLLAPRHPERFNAVADLAARAGFLVRRRSEDHAVKTVADILVLDSIGELASAYRFATIAFVGGTLIPRGGQTILEPACYAKPIVVGPSMENFLQVARDFLAQGALRQIHANESDKEAQIVELTDAFVCLLEDEERRKAMGRAAHSVFENNRGAARLTVDVIAGIYNEAGKPASCRDRSKHGRA